MNLYEMIYNFSANTFGGCYHLIIEKETEKMYYGKAVLLNNKNLATSFALQKEKIGKVAEIIEKNTLYYRTYVFAESDVDAYNTAVTIIYNYLIERVNLMLSETIQKVVLRKGFKGLMDSETKYATNCSVCGAQIIFEDEGRFFASSDYIGADMCRPCMEEHCKSTNCLMCDIGKYPNCKHLYLKET